MKYLPDLRDLVVFGGIALAAYGAWLIYAPCGFILAGVGLYYTGLWGVR